jgi:hypothetical protein
MTERERIAKSIAYWHGQKIVQHTAEGALTQAARAGYGSFGSSSADQYAASHWQQYTSAADAMIEEQRAHFAHGFATFRRLPWWRRLLARP